MNDPEERCSPGTDGPDPDAGLDDFDRIVAGWRREGAVPQWPADVPAAPDPAVAPVERPAAPPAPVPASSEVEAQLDEHFVPPEPPPLPRLGPPAFVGLALLGLGLLLIIAPSVLGMSSVYGLPLGLLALATGLGWLVLRLWPTPADAQDDEDDDGAVI